MLTRFLTAGSLFAAPARSEMGVMVTASVAGSCWIMGKVRGTPVRASVQVLLPGSVLLNL
jgi:hypothetical protein